MNSSSNPTRRHRVKRLASLYGVRVADAPVCPGHSDPLTFLTEWLYDRPALSVVHGPRGGGKSYLGGLRTHIDSQRFERHGTKILGGSLAQSGQVYNALDDFNQARPGVITRFAKQSAAYCTGSEVSILAASATSVRGPHVPSLHLDEVDEIPADLRESAVGMCMAKHGVPASITMTSTWHRVGGPMGTLKERAAAEGIPWHTFCAFEILERCPDDVSGPGLENCSSCPLKEWCHDVPPGTAPKAKRANGHYPVASLVQKARMVSRRVFEADYLCLAPKADGVWFAEFDPHLNVTEEAEYVPHLPVHLAIDSGVRTGAVAFQVRPQRGWPPIVAVFWDYFSEGPGAESAARAILGSLADRRGSKFRATTDPAGGARNSIGPTVIAEYERSGLRGIQAWPGGSVADALATVEALVCGADGTRRLLIHPRCRNLINAMQNYRRAKVRDQWLDHPEDPQHPWEDMVDALRGGLRAEFPEGFVQREQFPRRSMHRIFY